MADKEKGPPLSSTGQLYAPTPVEIPPGSNGAPLPLGQQTVILCGRLPNGQLAPIRIDPETGGVLVTVQAGISASDSGHHWAVAPAMPPKP